MYTVKIIGVSPDERIRLVYDEAHQTRGSYAYDTEEETRAAEEYEQARLDSGEWVALGRIVETRCPHCDTWKESDSLWGVVVENSDKGYAEAAADC